MFQMKRGAAANPYVLRSTQHMERVEQLLERMVTAIEKRDGKV